MFRIRILAVVVVALLRSSYSQSSFKSNSPPDGRPVCKAGCISTYGELEESILCKVGNIERLHGAFFRTNRQRSTVVTVTYWLDHCSDSDFEQECDNSTQRSYTFRSSRSSVQSLIQPELLERLSLYTYDGSGGTVKLSLYIKPFCVNESVGESVRELSCQYNINQNTNPIALSILNKATTWLLQYAKHPQSILDYGVEESGHGYSAFLYGKNFHDSCTLGADDSWPYKTRLSVYIGTVFLLIFSLCLPYVLKRYTLDFLKAKDDTGCALRAWSSGIITFLLNITLLGIDIATIQKGIQESSELFDFDVYFIIILIYLILLFLIKCVSSCVANCIEISLVSCTISCNRICERSFWGDSFLCTSITLTIEFICFHLIFIAASFYAAPLQVATLLFVYVSLIIYASIWIILFVKALYHTCHLCNGRHVNTAGNMCHYCTLCFFAFGVLLLLSGFSSFIIIQSLYVIEYKNIDGVSGYIGALAPPLIATTVGVVLTKPEVLRQLWRKMKGGADKQQSEEQEQGGPTKLEEE